MFLVNLARTNLDTFVPTQTALFPNGHYVQAAPGAILAILIFIGTAILLYIRVHQRLGPYLFATLFSCICVITNLTTAVLVPYSYYVLGRAIFIPLEFHSIISTLASIVLFPETLSSKATKWVAAVFAPLAKSCLDPFDIAAVNADNARNQAALGPLAQAAPLLPSEVAYARYIPRDWRPLQDLARRVAVPANGMLIDFTLVDPTRERFPVTPARTSHSTPVERHSEPPHHHHLSNILHRAHLHNSSRFHHRASSSYGNRPTSHAPVSVSESQIFLDLEGSSTPLLEQCQSATRGESSPILSTATQTERREKAKQSCRTTLCDLRICQENSSIPLSAWKPDLNVAISVFGRQSFIVLQVSLYSWNGSRVSGRTTINVGRSASAGAAGEEGEEEDPDRVQHVNCDRGSDIEFDELSGETRVGNRVLNDEDDNMFGEFMDRWIYNRVVGLTTGNALYVMKAGVLTSERWFDPSFDTEGFNEQLLCASRSSSLDQRNLLTTIGSLGECKAQAGKIEKGPGERQTEISLRAKWPEERYHTLFNLQMQISYSLSHLLSVIEHLEPA
ncbi:uncharacterized protein C8R40DRAFT_1173964 [Lentinula edodes]|uniref:uncharacterized protein n=1 Tax=Lentinula edodes TaxID=5353 RepID=UPI001E8CB76A|nr:uncharacterized protein C8R40DRAFT_1173964 [Lentinula edodes]KAH7872226.1 hypothetical protein C8R40DRAFT_1173964 [Lentinula edodes]